MRPEGHHATGHLYSLFNNGKRTPNQLITNDHNQHLGELVFVLGGVLDYLMIHRLQPPLHLLPAVLLDAFPQLLFIVFQLEADLLSPHSPGDHLLNPLEEVLKSSSITARPERPKLLTHTQLLEWAAKHGGDVILKVV